MRHIINFNGFINESENSSFNFNTVCSKISDIIDWDNQESESEDCLHFDKGDGDEGKSLWIYKTGSVEGYMPKKVKDFLKSNGAKLPE